MQLSEIMDRVDITMIQCDIQETRTHVSQPVQYSVSFANGGDGVLSCTVFAETAWISGLGRVPNDADIWSLVIHRYAMQPGQWYMLSDPMARSGQLVWAQVGEPYKKRIAELHENFRQRVLAFAGLDIIADSAQALLAEMDGKKHENKS